MPRKPESQKAGKRENEIRFTHHVSRITHHASRFAFHVGFDTLRYSTQVTFYVLTLLTIGGCSSPATNFQLSPADAEKLNPLLAELQLRYDLISTLKMQMIVTIEDKGEKEEVREYLWYKKSVADGDLLHIQAMGPLNEPRVISIAAREQFLLYFVNEQEAYLGPLEDQVLRDLFGMDLRVSDVRSAIFANPFLDGRTKELSLVQSGVKYMITRPGVKEGQIEDITIFVRDAEPTVGDWNIRDKAGVMIQKTRFSDYRDVGGILRPHNVEIERPIEKTRVVLKIVKPEINAEISDTKFQFDFLPEDTKFRPLRK